MDHKKTQVSTIVSKPQQYEAIISVWCRRLNLTIPKDLIEELLPFCSFFIPRFEGKRETRLYGTMSRGTMTSTCFNMQGYCATPLTQGMHTFMATVGLHTSCTKQIGIVSKLGAKKLSGGSWWISKSKSENKDKSKKSKDNTIGYYYEGLNSFIYQITDDASEKTLYTPTELSFVYESFFGFCLASIM